MRAQSFSHVGITVSDFNRFVQFYWDVFGCPLVGVAGHAAGSRAQFLRRRRPGAALQDRLDPRARRRHPRDLRVPAAAAAETIPWNRVGLTHFSFNVRNTQKWHDYLVSKGVECLSAPEQSPRGHWFFFAKDIDGNLIEMIDLRHMYYVLKWLGPLGGWMFRRGMYKAVLRADAAEAALRGR